MLEYDGLTAWISIEGSVTTEYASQVSEEQKKASCWIASEAGKPFEVHYRASSRPDILVGRLFIDGIDMGMDWAVSPEESFSLHASAKSFSTVPVSPTERRKLSFSTLIMTDDELYRDRMAHGSTGEITLELWTVQVQILDHVREHQTESPQLPDQMVHETSKKSGSHCVVLGEPVENTPTRSNRAISLVSRLVTFSFQYRPLAILQANEIAPRALRHNPELLRPSHPTSSASMDSSNEARRLKGQLLRIQARLDALSGGSSSGPSKRRVDVKKEDDGTPAKRVKTEVEVKPISLRGEVIDLTID